jgi:hypothetical protein
MLSEIENEQQRRDFADRLIPILSESNSRFSESQFRKAADVEKLGF